jgi:hypothetical protein
MSEAAEIRALVVTGDPSVMATFSKTFREFGVHTERSATKGGVPQELGLAKYEALLIDFDTTRETLPIFSTVRSSPANRNAVIFALVSDAVTRQRAVHQGATFVLERPLQNDEIRRVVHAAYGLMTRERRRYFRCTAELPMRVIRSGGEELICKTINISSNGMAASSSAAFSLGEKVRISLALEEAGSSIRAHATVVWDDRHGKTGLSFECESPQMQRELDAWLDTHFRRQLTS